ncbi:MAG: hypothetical protein AAB242_13620, partial [Nitrospirota bacterium]
MIHSAVRQGLFLFIVSTIATSPILAASTTPPSKYLQRCEQPHKKGTLSAVTMREILNAHQEWLEQRDSPGHRRADFCGADLRQAAL